MSNIAALPTIMSIMTMLVWVIMFSSISDQYKGESKYE